MEELLKGKLKAVKELENFTEKIRDISFTAKYDTVNTMLDERQKMIDNINSINEKINNEKIIKSKELNDINKEIKKVFAKTIELDNQIRKNVNNSLKNIKGKLNHPEVFIESINIKA